MNMMPLDTVQSTSYRSPVTANSVAGIAVPMWSGESRMLCGFFASGVSKLWAGRAGSRKARRCSTGTATRSVPPTPIAVGRRFVQRTGACTMSTSICASARILQLPTALPEPVQQHPRRGRYPKGVVSISRARHKRAYAQYLREQLDKKIHHAEAQAAVYAKAADDWFDYVDRLRDEEEAL